MNEPKQYEQELWRAVEILKSGGTILYPTDTIWGIGCDATNFEAVENVYKIKHRVESKSLIILLDEVSKLYDYVEKVPDISIDLINSLNKPTTIIYSNAKNLSPNVIATDGSIAIRVTKDPFCRDLIKLLGKPIVSTSANISGDPSPVIYRDVHEDILNGVDYVVNLYQSRVNSSKPSTIIRLFENGEFIIVRN
ncbi:MAG: L-threonylcarbamoyladenylate synthase [Bacteroidota bacterium]|nr:L-threonylcarbamoyladenylate synthase [Bacteroidota bacterium]